MKTASGETPACLPICGKTPDEGPCRCRQDKVDAIRHMVDSGCYDVPAVLVAERIVDKLVTRRFISCS
jgi:hypothetical protein